MEWLNIGAFLGGVVACIMGFILGWWARGHLSRKE